MALEKKHEQLNDEILALAKAGDYVSIKKNVDLQRKISEILQEKQKEQEIFDKRNFQDDILYQKAQELGDQELLDKFHSHSLTREKYINACKNLNIDLGVDYYYDCNFLAKYDEVGEFDEDGFASVELNRDMGLINIKEGKELCEPKYDWLHRNSKYKIAIAGYRPLCLLIDKDGKEFYKVKASAIDDFDEYGIAKILYPENKKICYVDTTGKEFRKHPFKKNSKR